MTAAPDVGLTRAVAVRALLYFALWIVVDQSAKPANLVVGLLASAAATWASVRLLPPASDRVRLTLRGSSSALNSLNRDDVAPAQIQVDPNRRNYYFDPKDF